MVGALHNYLNIFKYRLYSVCVWMDGGRAQSIRREGGGLLDASGGREMF
jgi:hypothetical protein